MVHWSVSKPCVRSASTAQGQAIFTCCQSDGEARPECRSRLLFSSLVGIAGLAYSPRTRVPWIPATKLAPKHLGEDCSQVKHWMAIGTGTGKLSCKLWWSLFKNSSALSQFQGIKFYKSRHWALSAGHATEMYQQLWANVRRWTTKDCSRYVVADSHGHHTNMHRKGSMPHIYQARKEYDECIWMFEKLPCGQFVQLICISRRLQVTGIGCHAAGTVALNQKILIINYWCLHHFMSLYMYIQLYIHVYITNHHTYISSNHSNLFKTAKVASAIAMRHEKWVPPCHKASPNGKEQLRSKGAPETSQRNEPVAGKCNDGQPYHP